MEKIVSSEFGREIRKLQVRLEDYLEANREFADQVRECVTVLRKLMENLKKTEGTISSQENDRLSTLRGDAIQSLAQVLEDESHVEHERSHIFESYGALIRCLEEEFENRKS